MHEQFQTPNSFITLKNKRLTTEEEQNVCYSYRMNQNIIILFILHVNKNKANENFSIRVSQRSQTELRFVKTAIKLEMKTFLINFIHFQITLPSQHLYV